MKHLPKSKGHRFKSIGSQEVLTVEYFTFRGQKKRDKQYDTLVEAMKEGGNKILIKPVEKDYKLNIYLCKRLDG